MAKTLITQLNRTQNVKLLLLRSVVETPNHVVCVYHRNPLMSHLDQKVKRF